MSSEQGDLKERLGAVLQALNERTPSHTPTPWVVEWDEFAGYDCMTGGYKIGVKGTYGFRSIVVLDAGRDQQTATMAKINAGFIARAVNSHDDLLSALKQIAANEEHDSQIGAIARAAIAKTEAQ